MRFRRPDSPRSQLILYLAIGGVLALAAAAVLTIWLRARSVASAPAQDEADEGTGEIAHRADADFPEGGVTTMDDRPVDTGAFVPGLHRDASETIRAVRARDRRRGDVLPQAV